MSGLEKLTGTEETQSESLVRGGLAFVGGLLFCGAALLAQAAWLQTVAEKKKAS